MIDCSRGLKGVGDRIQIKEQNMLRFLKSWTLLFCLFAYEISCKKSFPGQTGCKCGKEDPLSRIIGGSTANQNYPWIIQIFVEIPEASDTNLCSGTIINKKYVLTAGHCFVHVENGKSIKIPKSNVQVSILDSQDKWSVSDVHRGNIELKHNKIEQIIIHKDFLIGENGEIINDIALIKFTKDFSDTLKRQTIPRKFMPICLPTKKFKFVNREAKVIGWGLTDFINTSSISFDGLKEAKVQILNNNDKRCKKITAEKSDPSKVLCAYRKSSDACEGDSGGPLMLKTNWPLGSSAGMRYNIIGIVSYGLKCALPEYAGVYTRISGYLDWIQEHSKDGNCDVN